jgi:hypothetical protein
MFGPCTTSDCDKPSGVLSGKCNYHDAISSARNLEVDEFDRLREALAVTAPITDDERNVNRARYALKSIEWDARNLKRHKQMARENGATPAQIADAVSRGKAEVK